MRVPAYPDRRFASPPTAFEDVDVRGLEHDLERVVEGEVRFKPGDRALYTTGGSNYRQVPIGVVIPRTTDDVVETVRLRSSRTAAARALRASAATWPSSSTSPSI